MGSLSGIGIGRLIGVVIGAVSRGVEEGKRKDLDQCNKNMKVFTSSPTYILSSKFKHETTVL
jgi:hypothetical protein